MYSIAYSIEQARAFPAIAQGIHEYPLGLSKLNNLVHSQSASKQLMMMAVGGIDPYQ